MTKAKRRAPKWRAAFLRALSRTGNVRLSAERAGVDHSSAYYQRGVDAGFARAWKRALARASERAPLDRLGGFGTGFTRDERGRLVKPASSRPLHHAAVRRGPPPRSGADLIARISRNAGAQLVRVGEGRWSEVVEEAFIAALADNPNVRAAARAVGMSTAAVYARRMRDAAFRTRWAAAIDQGYARVEALMIDAAERALDPERIAEPPELPRATLDQAIAIWRLRPKERDAGGAGGEPSIEEVRAEVMRRLTAMRGAGVE